MRHALESFSQLVGDAGAPAAGLGGGSYGSCGPSGWLEASQITISDAPVYSYRGLMIDTGRHFISVPKIQHILDGLAMLKLNVLHWHMVDAESFAFKGNAFPELTNSAFARMAVYSVADVKQIVSYAKERGIQVIPEFDVPVRSHSAKILFPLSFRGVFLAIFSSGMAGQAVNSQKLANCMVHALHRGTVRGGRFRHSTFRSAPRCSTSPAMPRSTFSASSSAMWLTPLTRHPTSFLGAMR